MKTPVIQLLEHIEMKLQQLSKDPTLTADQLRKVCGDLATLIRSAIKV